MHDSIGQMDVIDLVPSLRNSFDKLVVERRQSHPAVTDAQAEAAMRGRGGGHHLGLMQMFFASLAAAQRRGAPDSSEEEDDSDEDFEMEDMDVVD